jgi:hypothetical protein
MTGAAPAAAASDQRSSHGMKTMGKTNRLSILTGGVSLALAVVLSGAYAVEARAQSGTTSSYDSIAVVKPADNSTVFNNAGDVAVTVAVSPALRTDAGDRIALILDGRRISVRRVTHFKLSGITRGEHTLEAQVLDSGGNALISSNTVNFHLWQASRLFPNRRGN